jgi:hypothetical protein
MTSANDKPTTMAARPMAQECTPDRRLEERLARLAAALQPRPSVTSQIALDTPDPMQASATSAGDKPAEVRRARRWPQTAAIAVSLAVAIAGWWLYRSEVANHAEMMISAATRAAGDLAEVKQALQQERDRTEKLTQELATAQRTLEAEAVALAKASDKTVQNQQLAALRQALHKAEASAATSQASLTQEHENAEKLARELTAARRELEAQAAALTKARDKTAAQNQKLTELQQALQKAEASAAANQASMAQERDKTEKQARELEAQAAALTKAGDKTTAQNQKLAELQQALQKAEASAAANQASLTQERTRSQGLEQQLAARRDATPARGPNGTPSLSNASGATQAPATDKPAVAASPADGKPVATAARPAASETPGNPEAVRLMARASLLLSQGNVSAARVVLERAAETGSAPALFALAETYDPVILAAWGTLGTLGDVGKAQELYAKAFAGGVQEAKARLNELR